MTKKMEKLDRWVDSFCYFIEGYVSGTHEKDLFT
jgi:hypothetical protein